MEYYTLIALAVYAVIIFAISLASKIREDGKGFVIGGRKTTAFGVGSSIAASTRDGTGVVFWITFAALNGISPVWMIVGFIVGFNILALFAPRIHAYSREYGAVTMQDIISRKIGNKLAIVTAIVLAFVALSMAAGNLFVMGSLMSTVTGVPKEIAVWGTAGVIATYLFIGGYTTVIRTDIFQWLILAVAIVVPFFMLDWPSIGELGTQFFGTEKSMMFGFFFIGLFYPFGSPDLWQRMMSTPTAAQAKIGVRLGSIMWPFITVGLIVLGLWLHQMMPGVDGNEMYNNIFISESGVPVWVAVSVALIVASAVMSTIDTFIALLTTTTVSTFFKIDTNKDHVRFVRISRVLILGFMAILAFMAIQVTDAVQLLLDLIMIVLVGGPAYIYVVLAKEGKCPVRDIVLASAVAVGVAVHLGIYVTIGFVTLAHNVIPVGVVLGIVLAYAGVSQLCKKCQKPA